jgi:hypothetical protein
MPKLNITTDDGTLITRIDLNEYDLNRDSAVVDLIIEIQEADSIARIEEGTDDE